MVGVFGRHLAVDSVLVALDAIAVRIAQGHHAAQTIEVIVVHGVTVGHFYHTHRLINARTVDVFAQEPVIAIGFDRLTTSVFGNDMVAVIAILDIKELQAFLDEAEKLLAGEK